MNRKKQPVERRQVSKQAISLRVDVDVLEWFKSGGPGYQTRMLSVLRAHMQAEQTKSSESSPA
jgi:uncharacterized protein (DUF4415 family)